MGLIALGIMEKNKSRFQGINNPHTKRSHNEKNYHHFIVVTQFCI